MATSDPPSDEPFDLQAEHASVAEHDTVPSPERANSPAENVTAPARPHARGERPSATGDRGSLSNYRLGQVLGRGGMGEVVVADDLAIGRQVAIKRLRSDLSSEDMVDRFFREARIQALLDHPAIVPVHEVGRDATGRPYFTMKRLSGTTLSEKIENESSTLQGMLRAYAEVCLAIEFAHARGFIHRDLKPSNVMLGEYGEVYVIDWGLARPTSSGGLATGDQFKSETQLGVTMGTPGYMSPEQARGERLGPPSDVYSLGVILFEILTRNRFDPGGDTKKESPLFSGETSFAASARPIPPELEALCIVALSQDAVQRPTARDVGERVQRYLDGDRDLERRRSLASDLLNQAHDELASGDPARRGTAIKAASRALALDPESEVAGALVAKMMIEPPPVMPPELVKRLDAIDLQQAARQAKRDGISLGVYFLFLPIIVAMGVLDWSQVATLYALVVLAILISVARSRRPRIPILCGLVANAAMLMALSRLTGPFLLVPTMVVGSAVLFLMFSELLYRPMLVIGTGLATLCIPIVLEAAGVWESTWQVTGGRLLAAPSSVEFGGVAGYIFVIGGSIGTAITFPLLVRALALAQRDGRRQLEVQAWHLQHLIPDTSRLGATGQTDH